MPNGPSDLDAEHRIKLDLLKDHYQGIFKALEALRGKGYIPDRLGSKDLAVAVDELYAEIERKG